MEKKIFKITAMAVLTGLVMTGCGSSSKTVSGGYAPEQKQPVTVEQSQAANRGLKLQKEECEDMALEATDNLRDSGNGISDKEAFATNLALLDARSKLAQQLEVMVNGLIRNFNQQHEADKDFASIAKAGQVQQAYFEQFLVNTRPICKNTYVKEDGKYNVYVCIEMGEQQKKTMYKQLSDDKKIAVDFAEKQFLDELNKAKEDFRQQQLKQQQ
ncbi:MAG: hypothetical protein LBP63_06940 [Prevotellaceae bacterium]|jgi:hypothetical protein|nr:hypothetical protein [Prevotellaceae bacterium]